MAKETIGIVGAGKWGRALNFAFMLKKKAMIWNRRKVEIENFAPLENILKLKFIVIALPAQVVGEWFEKFFVYEGQNILVASKGIELKNKKFLNEIVEKFVPKDKIAFLSGPSFADEVIKKLLLHSIFVLFCYQS